MSMRRSALAFALWAALTVAGHAQKQFQQDTIQTSGGDLQVTFLGHGTLMFAFAGKVIHVDPVSAQADYTALPKAGLVLVTHDHGDHLDPEAIRAISTPDTIVVVSRSCASKMPQAAAMANGETRTISGFRIEAVPAYNIVHVRGSGTPYHPKGDGNGYVITFADKRVYVAGDTENTPEMKSLKGIDVAFLPMNLPFTMTPEMVADAARALQPKILYPYHYGNTDTAVLVRSLKDDKAIEVRIREMQ